MCPNSRVMQPDPSSTTSHLNWCTLKEFILDAPILAENMEVASSHFASFYHLGALVPIDVYDGNNILRKNVQYKIELCFKGKVGEEGGGGI